MPAAEPSRAPLPDKLVVLTFDDSAKSHFTVARPLLKQYGFGATFFITEGFDFPENKRDYMTWEEIAQLHREGFEIGNHSRDHQAVSAASVTKYDEQLSAIDRRCAAHGIPQPISFAYPGNAIDRTGLDVLAKHGILFARRGGSPEFSYSQGGGVAYEPHLDHPLLIPTTGDARPGWQLEDFIRVVSEARGGRVAVVQFHGVPDTAHAWVNTSPEKFQAMMHYLAENKFQVIAMRDLAKYVDPQVKPSDAWGPIDDRRRRLAANLPLRDSRAPRSDADRDYWFDVMAAHRYTLPEMEAATGLTRDQVANAAREATGRSTDGLGQKPAGGQLLVLPYPGGRHPRIGFRDGAIRPQRETKFSVFAPWNEGGYIVVDVPEAIWVQQGQGRELLYLAHSHIPTRWDRLGKSLPALEWNRPAQGKLEMERELPDGTTFGARVESREGEVQMELWIRNGTNETLRGLSVQNCVMLREASGFQAQSNDNKRFRSPLAVASNEAGDRWIITGWSHAERTWGNPPCPCLHSDPRFPDCEPGQTQRLVGRLAFYQGTDIETQLQQLANRWQLDSLSR